MQELPPLALVKTWLEIAQKPDIPLTIKEKRIKLLTYYFGSIQEARKFVEENDNYQHLAIS